MAGDAFFPITGFPITGPARAEPERATVERIRERLVAGRRVTAAETDEHLADVSGGALDLANAPLISASGRRPPDA